MNAVDINVDGNVTNNTHDDNNIDVPFVIEIETMENPLSLPPLNNPSNSVLSRKLNSSASSSFALDCDQSIPEHIITVKTHTSILHNDDEDDHKALCHEEIRDKIVNLKVICAEEKSDFDYYDFYHSFLVKKLYYTEEQKEDYSVHHKTLQHHLFNYELQFEHAKKIVEKHSVETPEMKFQIMKLIKEHELKKHEFDDLQMELSLLIDRIDEIRDSILQCKMESIEVQSECDYLQRQVDLLHKKEKKKESSNNRIEKMRSLGDKIWNSSKKLDTLEESSFANTTCVDPVNVRKRASVHAIPIPRKMLDATTPLNRVFRRWSTHVPSTEKLNVFSSQEMYSSPSHERKRSVVSTFLDIPLNQTLRKWSKKNNVVGKAA